MYGDTLNHPGSTSRTPSGRESWNGAKNQAKGNIEWMLTFLDSEEIIGIIVNQNVELVKNIHPVSKRYKYLQALEDYLTSMEERCNLEIERLEEIADPDDLKTSESDSLEEVILNE
jgi:hypothetical protein